MSDFKIVKLADPLVVNLNTVEEFADTFESVNKNLRSWDATLTYTGTALTSIAYTDGTDTITKTFAYTGSQLDSITLSGDTPAGIDLIKTLGYTTGTLTSLTYS